MLEDIAERREALIEMLSEKNADRRAVYEQLESVNRMLGINDDPNLPTTKADKVVEEWEAAFLKGTQLPRSLTDIPSKMKTKNTK